ncbi:methyltransferase domain-containing protein [Actinoplanes sp. NPDC023801]|uniref:class I SAM-dependent methyltransferase n=1 Tax=Actinoplanes sp. NPDC023801 TaxID=3154595 RepID=UPI0033CD0B32
MTTRARPAGDFDYEQHGAGYASVRRPDRRIAARVQVALGADRTVLNVGAGAGPYEPADRDVLAVEPSAAMRAQRPVAAAPAVDAAAEHLPFDDDSFDAAMAMFTVHQWG